MDIKEKALQKHAEWKGKLEVTARTSVRTSQDLSLAYTPGVAQPCLEIQKDPEKSFELTRRWNLIGVITDGTAVLGLGDIGPEAGMPVMEGKCVLFKEFAGIDAFPLCIRSRINNTMQGFTPARTEWALERSIHRLRCKPKGGGNVHSPVDL